MLISATGQEALVLLDASTFWLRATEPTTLYKDALGTPVSADGDSVYVAQDALGRSLCFGKTSGDLPTYNTSVGAASSALGFTASASRYLELNATSAPGIMTGGGLTLASLLSASAKTIIFALRVTADATQRGVFQDHTGGYVVTHYVASGGNFSLTGLLYDGTNDTVANTSAQSTWAVFTVRHSGGTLGIRRDGGAWTTAASGATTVLTGRARVGSGFTFQCLTGHLAQLATWNTALSDDNAYQVEKYIGASVGLSL